MDPKHVDRRYQWMVRSYKDDELMLETVHMDEQSKDMEVRAAESCGRTTVVIDLREERNA